MMLRAELDTPDFALSTAHAQWGFFGVVNRLVPEVLEELHSEPLQIYMDRRASLEGCSWLSYRVLKELTENPDPDEPDLTAVRGAIEMWAAKWNLSAPWVYGCACNTLEMWRGGNDVREFFPDIIRYTPATPLYSREFFPEQVAAAFEGFMGYEPTGETAPEFKRRFEDVCKTFLGTYMADQERTAASRSYTEYPDKRKLELHLEWAVLYQVREMSPDAVVGRYEKGDATEVRKRIHSALKFIKLEPRKPKRGG